MTADNLQPVTEGSQGRSSCRKTEAGAEAQRLESNTAFWVALERPFSYLSYRVQARQPRDGVAHIGQAPFMLVCNMKIPCSRTCTPIWWRHFLNWRVLARCTKPTTKVGHHRGSVHHIRECMTEFMQGRCTVASVQTAQKQRKQSRVRCRLNPRELFQPSSPYHLKAPQNNLQNNIRRPEASSSVCAPSGEILGSIIIWILHATAYPETNWPGPNLPIRC